MTAALLLTAYVVAAGSGGAQALRRWTWINRSPRCGILAWQALSFSVVLASLLVAIALALPFLPLRHAVAGMFGAHTLTVIEHYETPMGPWPGVAALTVVGFLAAKLALAVTWRIHRAGRARRAQRKTLALVGHRHPEGFTIIEHAEPMAYCLPGIAGHPGRHGTVVLSTAALALLTDGERRLVLGHERRHLRARHDLALACADALRTTFPRVALFSAAHREITVLVEMAADDAATTAPERRTLAQALVALGTGTRPEVALGASDTAAVQRVRRLTAPVPRRRAGQGSIVAVAALAVLSLPVSIALAPAIEAAARECCAIAPLAVEPS
ncbi:M56 family metallopeptidase [Nocardioides sp. IC4_145]|uniref:M56 family metallopeptidase n=1 Tax=Nocardioides sp. IC4_145 TaxID=2714037 RepID=UPI00140C1C19|nr:M56 family metallopeptidase [Nocardioides sp. IC4_145]NHC22945.1 M56 family metallopeptidase [Nocardioides sp. IC4_145]